ncbi:MAG: hypothetical protein EPO32_04580 [Anaerolineae bacterium]|nr:MAG: hypothetical protein EPO32_04580 [Anaerolineae bacterium]
MRKWLSGIFALVALVNCLLVAIIFTSYSLSTANSLLEIFPFPALYLFEIAVVGILGLIAAGRANAANTAALWPLAGILLAFVILGGFSIGPFLLPAFFSLPLAALLSVPQAAYPPLKGMAWLGAAAVVQALWMLLFTRF